MLNLPYFDNINEIQIVREKIVSEAKKLYGVPFANRGRTRWGLDCMGLCLLAYHRSGIDIPDGDGKLYEPNWFKFTDEERYLNGMLKYFNIVDRPKLGDLVAFKFFGIKTTHAGIIINIEENKFINACSGKKVIINGLEEKKFSKRFSCFLRYKGFKD